MRPLPHSPRAARLARPALATLAALAALAAAACVDRTVGPRAVPATLALAVGPDAASIPNGSIQVDVFYRRDNATSGPQVSILSLRLRSDSLGASLPASFDPRCAQQAAAGQAPQCQVSVPIKIDLAPCLADARRSPAGAGCPLFATLVLRDGAAKLVAQATVGPVQAIPGQPVVMPDVVLPLRGS